MPRRKPRKPTPSRIENWALHYLSRFGASKARVGEILTRRIGRYRRLTGEPVERAEEWITTVLDRLEGQGFIDDRAYSLSRARVLLNRGYGPYRIERDLRARGIEGDLAKEAIAELSEAGGEPELRAALRLAERRRLGAFASEKKADETDRTSLRERDLRTMARAGIGYATARRVLEAGPDEIDDLRAEAEGLD